MSKEAPGHTDLMVCPETIDKWLEENPPPDEENDMTYRPNETVYCRFTGEAFTVISCNGCVAILRDGAGSTTGRIVGELTRNGG